MTPRDLDKKEVFKLLESEDTYATVLHAICLLMYPDDLYAIDSLELYARLRDDFGTFLSDSNESKLQAIMTALSTPFFTYDVTVFKSICKTLTTGDPGIVDLDLEDPTLLEILWGIYEVELNDESDIDFHPNIHKYINSIINSEVEDFSDMENAEEVVSSYDMSIIEMANDLKSQLKRAGFKNVNLKPKKTYP